MRLPADAGCLSDGASVCLSALCVFVRLCVFSLRVLLMFSLKMCVRVLHFQIDHVEAEFGPHGLEMKIWTVEIVLKCSELSGLVLIAVALNNLLFLPLFAEHIAVSNKPFRRHHWKHSSASAGL